MALCLFFLVSGFVVPYALERGTLGSFFVRRFFRLYPTLWVVPPASTWRVLALQARVPGGRPSRSARRTSPATPSSSSPYLRMPWIEPVLWSLAVEELFYVLAALGGVEAPAGPRGPWCWASPSG